MIDIAQRYIFGFLESIGQKKGSPVKMIPIKKPFYLVFRINRVGEGGVM